MSVQDEFDQLVKISRVLGTDELHRYCEKYGVEMDPRLVQASLCTPLSLRQAIDAFLLARRHKRACHMSFQHTLTCACAT